MEISSTQNRVNMDREIRALVDQYRDRCLWFLRKDYYPETTEEILRVTEEIRRHGDREAFRRAREVEKWVSHHSSGTSAGS